jgi:hypothetical protein
LFGNPGERMSKFIKFSPTLNGHNSFGSGFFSNYRVVLDQLICNDEIMFGTPYVDWSNTAWVDGYNPFNPIQIIPKHENPFDFWFDQKIPSEIDTIENPLNILRHTKIDHSQDYFDDKLNLQIQRFVESKYLKIKKPILDKVDQIFNDELRGEVTLGVIARGCEFPFYHPNYGVYGIYDYVNEIKKILKFNNKITKLFLVSEDSNYINILKENFSNSYHMPDVFRRTDETLEYMNKFYLWPNISNKRQNQNKLLGEETIIQTKLLGKCDYLFGIHSGIFAGAVLWGERIQQLYKLK